MDKKKVLYVQEIEKAEARRLAEKFTHEATEIQELYEDWISKDITAAEALVMIEKFTSQPSTDFIKQSLLVKYAKVVKQFSEDYAGIQINKVLDNFTSEEDEKFLNDLMDKIQISLRTFSSVNRMVRTIKFEHFLHEDQLEVTRAVKDRIRIATTVFCENQKQVELADACEQIRKVILAFQKRGTLGKNTIEATISKLMEVDSGKINYGQIMRY